MNLECFRASLVSLLALALSGLPPATAGAAPASPPGKATGAPGGSIKCWTNRDGLRECGNVVPPEYAQGGHSRVSRSGAVQEIEGARTPEQVEAERQQAEEERTRQQLAAERAAQDRVLLHTFTTEDDLILTRDGKVGVIDARIRLLQSRVADLEKSYRQLREQAAQEERAGQGMSDALRQDLTGAERQIAEHRQFIVDQRREQDDIRARFEGDLTRFRALKSGAVKPGAL